MESGLEELFDKSMDELYLQLGKELQSGVLGSHEKSGEDNIDFAKDWLYRKKFELQKRICGSLVVDYYFSSNKTQNRIMLAAAVSDLIASMTKTPAALTVSVLLIKEGLETYCERAN